MGGVEGGRSSSKTLPEMSITSDEVNFLVYRYLQESGAWPGLQPFSPAASPPCSVPRTRRSVNLCGGKVRTAVL
jgi:hypothetical protein